jgi:hypothetical protein
MKGAISTLWARVIRIYILREKSEKPYQFPACHPHSLLRHKLSNHKQLLSLKIHEVAYSLICMIYISRRENVGICCKRENKEYYVRNSVYLTSTKLTLKFICCRCNHTAWSDAPMNFVVKITILWSVALCTLVDRYSPPFQSSLTLLSTEQMSKLFHPEDGSARFLQNVHKYLTEYMFSHVRSY